ncbi:hypothetical protein BV22DRAFT_1024968, partial [Leucogyrophana mollusca]
MDPPALEGPAVGDQPEARGFDNDDIAELSRVAKLADITDTMVFINAIRGASLDNDCLHIDPDALDRLRNPPQHVLAVDDPDVLLSLRMFLADTTEEAYNAIRDAIKIRHPDDELLSYFKVKRHVAILSGITPLVHDMCVASCIAYCGPWRHHIKCPRCNEFRFDQAILRKSRGKKKVPRRTFETIPV